MNRTQRKMIEEHVEDMRTSVRRLYGAGVIFDVPPMFALDDWIQLGFLVLVDAARDYDPALCAKFDDFLYSRLKRRLIGELLQATGRRLKSTGVRCPHWSGQRCRLTRRYRPPTCAGLKPGGRRCTHMQDVGRAVSLSSPPPGWHEGSSYVDRALSVEDAGHAAFDARHDVPVLMDLLTPVERKVAELRGMEGAQFKDCLPNRTESRAWQVWAQVKAKCRRHFEKNGGA